MFMDDPITPARVEIVIDVLRASQGRTLKVETVRQLVQPRGLPARTEASAQAAIAIGALRELDLVEDVPGGAIHLKIGRDVRQTRDVLIDALDKKVLATGQIEPWFGLFYAYLLGQENGVAEPGAGKYWEEQFNRQLFGDERVPNRFNASKYQGFRRWFRYLGLGWHDPADVFQPNPYGRLKRCLAGVFGKDKSLDGDSFMERMSSVCAELDGGEFFKRANKSYEQARKQCSVALSHALIDLHQDGIVSLDCPIDSTGWSIAAAAPPRDEKWIRSDRFDRVHIGARH